MGVCSSINKNAVAPKKKTTDPCERQISREISTDPNDIAILKLNICKDRISNRIENLEINSDFLHEKIKEQLKNQNKDQARCLLLKQKNIKESLKTYRNKNDYIEKTIENIQYSNDNLQFQEVVEQSNTVLGDLNKTIDLEEIETAKMLEKEFEYNNQMINEYANSCGDDIDAEIEMELEQIEANLLKSNFEKVEPENTKSEEKDNADGVKETEHQQHLITA